MPKTTIADLLGSDEFLKLVLSATVADAVADGKTGARLRLDRRITASSTVAFETAENIRVTIAASDAVRTAWDAGDASKEIAAAVSATLDAKAAGTPIDFVAVERSMTDDTTIRILTAAWIAAAHTLLALPELPPALKKLMLDNGLSFDAMRGFATRFAPYIVTSPTLLQYGGDLTDVPTADVSAAIASLMQDWSRLIS